MLDQVRTAEEDLLDLSFADDSFDLVVSLTGLHVVPDPVQAARESLARVLRPGGRLTGSALMTDTGRRFDGLRAVGRLAGVLGPSLATPDLIDALADAGLTRIRAETSGAFVYFQAVKAP